MIYDDIGTVTVLHVNTSNMGRIRTSRLPDLRPVVRWIPRYRTVVGLFRHGCPREVGTLKETSYHNLLSDCVRIRG